MRVRVGPPEQCSRTPQFRGLGSAHGLVADILLPLCTTAGSLRSMTKLVTPLFSGWRRLSAVSRIPLTMQVCRSRNHPVSIPHLLLRPRLWLAPRSCHLLLRRRPDTILRRWQQSWHGGPQTTTLQQCRHACLRRWHCRPLQHTMLHRHALKHCWRLCIVLCCIITCNNMPDKSQFLVRHKRRLLACLLKSAKPSRHAVCLAADQHTFCKADGRN